jgi:REP-associated tyrosine transposase
MPDHVHLLLEATAANADPTSFVARAKQKSGFDFAARYKHRLWQKGYYERVMRADQPTTEVIRYIIANPVRARLVVEANEYPFWGSSVHSRETLIEFISMESERHR